MEIDFTKYNLSVMNLDNIEVIIYKSGGKGEKEDFSYLLSQDSLRVNKSII